MQQKKNQEMRRLFAEHLRSLPQEPISSSFDLFGLSSRGVTAGETAQGSGVAGGTSQVYHIGTPSGSENTGSSLFQSIPSQRSSIPSHPTSSPISFGPSTPVMSASAAPAGLLSSPGGMSDVGGTLPPPGLPLQVDTRTYLDSTFRCVLPMGLMPGTASEPGLHHPLIRCTSPMSLMLGSSIRFIFPSPPV